MILQKIIEKTRADLEKRKTPQLMEKYLRRPRKFRNVKKALRSTPDNPYRIIGEIKKASPSRGVIREEFDPIAIAQIYNRHLDAISILTEPHFFRGSLEYLAKIDQFSQIPLLRKDFIIDRFQVAEAYYYGADFFLLIVAGLEKETLKDLYNFGKDLGLEALVEVHNREELEIALEIGAEIIGFNHRDLKTFQMNMELGEELIPLMPEGTIKVAESGIHSFEVVKKLHNLGVDAFLVGEFFMKQPSIEEGIKILKGEKESSNGKEGRRGK
ncbi:MAG: indole-3-glycerol phosphate synthase TrpC [Epsilonproteobacteria bacterium]|nr:indole-3-glycerol phosphate synthase TrpC [Campylobacterota bacterium]NPA89144.1 indole-3-glycerol phosphate synthase TrpC [Campylobacterota bacterium]